MEFYEEMESNEFEGCTCDDYSYYGGCDDDNEGWHSDDSDDE